MKNALLQCLDDVLCRAGAFARSLKLEGIASKARLDYVTNIDHRLDEFLTRELEHLTPGVPVLSEERCGERPWPERAFWIIDPLDGTHNLIAGVPFTAISAALVEGRRSRLAGVHDIAACRTYLAEAGGGSCVDGSPIRICAPSSRLFVLSSGLLDELAHRRDIFTALRRLGKVRNLGAQSLHLCYVAEGRFGAVLSEEARFWDDAAGSLVAAEAGAHYRSFFEQPLQNAPMRSLCAHPEIAETVTSLMEQVWRPS